MEEGNMYLLSAVPTKHKIVLGLVDLLVTFVVWSQLLLVGEVIRSLAGGFPAFISCLLLAFYIGSFLSTLLVCTFIVAIFYTVLKSFGLF